MEKTPQLTEPTPQEMRTAMSAFATGVTIVTGHDGEPIGFACQSFASVSLEPPLVLFCADHRGRAWPRIRTTGRFTINVLTEAQSEVCERFGSSRGRKFEELDWEMSGWGTPCVQGAMMRVHAEVHDVHVAGDHDIVIGRVLALDTTPDEERPMVFYRGRFGIDDPHAAIAPSLWGWGDRWG